MSRVEVSLLILALYFALIAYAAWQIARTPPPADE